MPKSFRCVGVSDVCRTGDAVFHLANHHTPGAIEVIALVGVLDPFDEGALQTLPRLTGLNLSASTVQRTTESIGTDVAERRAAGETFADDEVWDWYRDAADRKVAYVELYATGVPKQGEHGEKVEGRMPWVGVCSIRRLWIYCRPRTVARQRIHCCTRTNRSTDCSEPLCIRADESGRDHPRAAQRVSFRWPEGSGHRGGSF
jgi:hypothetical protein